MLKGLHAFDDAFRKGSRIINRLPVLNERDIIRTKKIAENGQQFIANILSANSIQENSVTLLCTGPLTTIARALDLNPMIESKIQRVVWMGGALDVPGNVEADGSNFQIF